MEKQPHIYPGVKRCITGCRSHRCWTVLVNSRERVLDETRPFSERTPYYFRLGARVSMRKDKARTAWVIALDIQNLAGIEDTNVLSRPV